VEPSLKIKYLLDSESDSYLTSLAPESKVSLNFKIYEEAGKFVDLQVKGLLVSVLSKNSIIALEGSSMQLNLALKTGILVKNYTIFENISVEIHISDGINYDIYEQKKFSEVSFFKESMPI
jgi:hypothetical protein